MLILADAWVHDLSPFLVRLTPTLGIRYYGLAYGLAFVFAFVMLRRLSQRGLVCMAPQRVGDAMLIIVLGVLIGGRLGYVLLYDPKLLIEFSNAPPWWGLLAINKGGMASHGGILGVIVAAWFLSKGFKNEDGTREGACSMLHILDVLALLTPVGLFLGRIANFINGELLGRVAALPGAPSPWWSVKFPQEILTGHWSGRSAEQEQALQQLALEHALPGQTLGQAYARLVELSHAGTQEGKEILSQLSPLLAARHPSQLYQAFAEGVVLGLVLLWIWRKPRKPGVVGAWFMIVYGVLRITTEFWRLPDDGLKVQRLLGLSRGQWFSSVMILIGWLVLVYVRRSDSSPMGGWKRETRTEPRNEPMNTQQRFDESS